MGCWCVAVALGARLLLLLLLLLLPGRVGGLICVQIPCEGLFHLLGASCVAVVLLEVELPW